MQEQISRPRRDVSGQEASEHLPAPGPAGTQGTGRYHRAVDGAKPSGRAPRDGEMGSHPQRCSGSLGDFNQLWHSQLLCGRCKATG